MQSGRRRSLRESPVRALLRALEQPERVIPCGGPDGIAGGPVDETQPLGRQQVGRTVPTPSEEQAPRLVPLDLAAQVLLAIEPRPQGVPEQVLGRRAPEGGLRRPCRGGGLQPLSWRPAVPRGGTRTAANPVYQPIRLFGPEKMSSFLPSPSRSAAARTRWCPAATKTTRDRPSAGS